MYITIIYNTYTVCRQYVYIYINIDICQIKMYLYIIEMKVKHWMSNVEKDLHVAAAS